MSNIFLIVVFLASLLYIGVKYTTRMKKASPGKITAAVLPSIVLIGIAMMLIYTGNNWISGLVTNMYLIVFIQFIYVLLILSVCTFLINLLFKKMTSKPNKKTA